MTEEQTRSFSTQRGEFTIRVNSEKFEQAPGSVSERAKVDRKYNIRIKQDDICLLDAIAKLHGVTRSSLINEILHEIMRDELMSIEEDDARVLLAHFADQSGSYDDLSQPWVYDALASEFRLMLKNVLEYGDVNEQQPEPGMPSEYYHSPTYLGLQAKLEGLSK